MKIFNRGLAWSKKKCTCISAKTPVVMLAGTVDSRKRFLMQKHPEIMTPRHLIHHRHKKHIVVIGKICLLEYRGKFELIGSNLVVACLTRYAEFVSLYFKIEHKCLYPPGDCSEIMVLKLLILSRLMPHQSAPGEHKIRTCRIESLIHKKILLFPTEI